MKTLLEVTTLMAGYLEKRGLEGSRRESEWLVSHALGLKRLDIYVFHDRPVTEQELSLIRPLLERRGNREPLQYIMGEVDFLGAQIEVNPSVLIPRPETEDLADRIVKSIKDPTGKVLWDICTGSGCLGIAIKKKLPELTVIMSDISPQACEMARRNALKNNVDVTVLMGDFLEPFKGLKADYVVSNPPYISHQEFSSLQVEVRDFEPKLALVSGDSGLEFYEKLARELPNYLNKGAKVWLELGPAKTDELFLKEEWKEVLVENDMGGLPRFLSFRGN